MRFIYKYGFTISAIFACLLVAAVIYALRSPGDLAQHRLDEFILTQEEKNWIRDNPKVTVGADLDFAPIEQLDKTGKYIGVTADFLALISEKTGLTFNVDTTHTWAQSIERIKAGKIQMLSAAVSSPQRRKFLDFSQPYAWLSGVIIVKKSVTVPMTPERLKGMKVAVVHNYIWRDILEKSYPDIDLSPSKDIEAALKKVSFGMADAMVGYMATASHHIEQLGISNLKISGDTLSVVDISFAVNKSCPQLTRIINHVLSTTPKSRKKQILHKWISLEFSQANNFKWLTRILFPAVVLIILGLVGIIIWNQSLQRQVAQRTDKLNRELLQRTLMEKALRVNEEKYRSIFDNIQDVYFEIRPLGKVLQISPSVEKVFGYNRLDLINNSLARMFASYDEFSIMRTLAVQEDRLNDHEILLVCQNGKHANCSMNTTLVRDEEGNPAKIIGSIRDITERVTAQKALRASYNELEQRVQERTAELRDANKALNQAKEAADAATRAKSNFLANMSHEIRTPLGGVISASELVMNESLPPDAAKYIKIIRTSGSALLSVIDDILDFTKIEAGKLDLEHHPFELTKLISRSTDLFTPRFMEKQIRFSCTLAPDAPTHLKGDGFRIQQVLTNLLNNAVKFTQQGGTISLQVSWQPEKNNPESAVIEFVVEDSGIGISPEYREMLFSPFAQVDASTTRKYGGSGLGLSICRQLVEAMHGSIQVQSTPGEGSRFSFNLPLEIVSESQVQLLAQASALPPGEYRALLKGKRILVAEDNPTNQEIILAVLDLAGITSVLADNGEKAVTKAAVQPFHAVLMDLQMPVMDGFEATRAIRKLDNGRNLPIIAMTAHALKEDETRCRDAGMDDYISKPINQEKLFSSLIRHIYDADPTPLPKTVSDSSLGPDPTQAIAGGQISLPPELPGLQIHKAMTALGVSESVFLRILTTFLRDITSVLDQIKSAWHQADREKVIRLIHSLKGSTSGIGAETAHKLALDMENLCRQSAHLIEMDAAGLPDLEKEINEVLVSIGTVVPAPDPDRPHASLNKTADTKTLCTVLAALEQALEFPELTELDDLLEKLSAHADIDEITVLKDQILSHDYEIARHTAHELQTILRR
jgi:PAS domain S-box-containing protein